jgi:hypothetical protein
MEIRNNNEALESIASLEAFLDGRLKIAKAEISSIESQLSRWRELVSRVENGLAALQEVRKVWNLLGQTVPALAPSASNPRDSLNAVVSLLRAAHGPMRAKEIAQEASAKKLIDSTKGAAGVEAMVRTMLSRNEQVFVNIGWGWWDLVERKQKGNNVIRLPDKELVLQMMAKPDKPREAEPDESRPKTA